MKKLFLQRLKSAVFGTIMGLCIPTLVLAQTATLLPNAKQQYFDAAGNPVAGGTVTYYVPGTTTKKTVWQDPYKATPQSNPVVLDSAGRPQPGGQTFGDGTYRQLVKSSSGTTVWDANTASTGSGGNTPVIPTNPTLGDGSPVGTEMAWASSVLPSTNWMFENGQAVSRTTYSVLMSALTITQQAICASGVTTITGLSDTTQIPIGAKVEATCIAPGSTVVSKTSTTVVLSVAATANLVTSATFFPFGNGDGATTFNLPDRRGVALAGRPNMGGTDKGNLTSTYYGANPLGLGVNGGNESGTLVTANLPPYTPAGTVAITDPGHNHVLYNSDVGTNQAGLTTSNYASYAGSYGIEQSYTVTGSDTTPTLGNSKFAFTSITAAFTGTAQGGTTSPFSRVQPTSTTNYIIKVLADYNQGYFFSGSVVAPVRLSTLTILPNAPVYSNGTAGVGATLTATSNGALSLDSVAVALNDRVLIRNQTDLSQNGIYTVTTLGTVSVPYILTRATDFDTHTEMTANSTTLVTSGNTLTDTKWTLQSTVNVVGTDPVVFIQTSAGLASLFTTPHTWTATQSFVAPNPSGVCSLSSFYAPTPDQGNKGIICIDNTWDGSNGGLNGAGLVVNSTVKTTAGAVGAPGAIQAGVLVKGDIAGLDPYGITTSINNDSAVTVPVGTAQYSLVRGAKATGGTVDGHRSVSEVVAGEHPRYGFVAFNSNPTNAYKYGFGAVSATDIGVVVGNPDAVGINDVFPTWPFAVWARNLTTSVHDGLLLYNATAATSGVPIQSSPAVHWAGAGWKTDATAASQALDWFAYLLPAQGTANPSSKLVFASQVNGAGTTNKVFMTSGNGLGVGASPNVAAQAGDLTVYRGANSGAIQFGDGGSKYILQDGANWTFNGGAALGFTSIFTPVIYGGSAANSALILQSTSNGSPSGDVTYVEGSAIVLRNQQNLATLVSIGASGQSQAQLQLAGSTSGSTTLTPAAAATGTLTVPSATDTLVARATTDTLTNKSMDGGANTFTNLPGSSVVGAALTKTDDTNVTLTLGGTPATALLRAASITVGWIGTLAPSRGGTGIASLGTGVATALGINVGSAGAFVVNGGALGSPSSVGTLPAHTLGGTISGGGNQINNVVIGASTPLAGSFTTIGGTDITASGFVQAAGTSGFKLGSSVVLDVNGTYVRLKTLTGEQFFISGNTGDPTNYYDRTTHKFRLADNSTVVQQLDSTGAIINTGGLSVGTTQTPTAGQIYINNATYLIRTKTSFTNGSGASAGTLTNAPAVGNPTKWIAIDDNGTTRYIPAW